MLSGHPSDPRNYRNHTTNPRNADGFQPQRVSYSNPYGDGGITGVIPGAALTYARRTPEPNPLALRPGEEAIGDQLDRTSSIPMGGQLDPRRKGNPQAMRQAMGAGMNTGLGATRSRMGRA